jgi:Na+/melibiose symporter-like transporter
MKSIDNIGNISMFEYLVMFIAIAFVYNLNKKKVAEMTADLAEKRAALTSAENE